MLHEIPNGIDDSNTSYQSNARESPSSRCRRKAVATFLLFDAGPVINSTDRADFDAGRKKNTKQRNIFESNFFLFASILYLWTLELTWNV